MPTFAWVATNILAAAIGGATATWVSMSVFNDLEPQPDVVIRNLMALGGVFAGLCGGIASIGRIHTGTREDLFTGVATLALGLVGVSIINPGYLVSPLLLLRAPIQGIAALLGGLASIAVLWSGIRLAGIRNESRLASAGNGNLISPLKKLGCGCVLFGSALPLLAFFGNSPVILWISLAALCVGVPVYATAFFTDVWVTLSNQAMQRTRDKIGPDGKSKVASH